MPLEVHDVPAHDDRAGGEGAHGDEAEAGVLGVEVVVRGHEEGEAGDGEEGAEGDEGVAEVEAVGEVGHELNDFGVSIPS